MKDFLIGALSMASAVAALCLLRSWRITRDRLFVFFAAAFFALAVHWLGLAWVQPAAEAHHEIYLVRLAAFVLILAGIVDKNRRG
jgi:hypothetical protein